jgi:hypothetical protein
MAIELTRFVLASVEEVFAFFDDPANTLTFSDHAVGFHIVEAHPDGRRTFDVAMRAGRNDWTQTIEQVIREPPARLTTRSGSWNTDRGDWLITAITDRRFSTEDEGTRVDVTIEMQVHNPFRRLVYSTSNWLRRDIERRHLERQFDSIAIRIERESEQRRAGRETRA